MKRMSREVRQRAQEEFDQLTKRIKDIIDLIEFAETNAEPVEDVNELEEQLDHMKKYHEILERRLKENDKLPEVITDTDRLKKLQDGAYQIWKELDEAWYHLSMDAANGPAHLKQERMMASKRVENWKNRLYNLVEESKK